MPAVSSEPGHAIATYPGGLRVSYRWAGSGQGPAVFALSETGGPVVDHGPMLGPDFERLCRAEVRVEHPGGAWAVRLASPIFDEPSGWAWDTAGLLVVGYGFVTYAFDARHGDLRWSHRARSPMVAVLGSTRLPHVLAQTEVETFALEEDGEVRWRAAHSDVVASAQLVGSSLVLTSYGGQVMALDAASGEPR